MGDSLKIAMKTTTQTATAVQSAFQLLKNGDLFVFTKPIATSKYTSTKRNYCFAHWKYLIKSNKQMQTFAILTAHGPFCHWTWTQMTWRVTKHTSIQKHINMQKKQHRDVFKASVNNTRIQRMRMNEIKKILWILLGAWNDIIQLRPWKMIFNTVCPTKLSSIYSLLLAWRKVE